MATKSDLELAKMLLGSRILDEPQLRTAFEQQGQWLHEGRLAALPEVLYALGLLPEGSLAALHGPGPEVTQPFPGYHVDGLLGEGGMSMVYAATYLSNGARVALKVLKPLIGLRPDFVARFEEEAQLLMRLEHPNIVAAFEAGRAGGYRFFSMELVGGSTAQEIIEQRGHLTNAEALSITLQTAKALDHLHQQGLLHRDMKPANVMVEPDGRARLIDLGLVGRLGGAAAGAESTTHTVGTVEYLSPEQARGRADIDARSDIYSLGVSLYHMVVGEVPFQGETDMEVMAKQIMSSMDHDKVKTRRISPELNFFIAKMTAKERESRFASLAEVIRTVGGYLPQGIVPVDLGAPPRVIPMSKASAGRAPTRAPTRAPLVAPLVRPSAELPARRAMPIPTARPIAAPVATPLVAPTVRPLPARSAVPVAAPVARPATAAPMAQPIARVSAPPIAPPIAKPLVVPTATPLRPPSAVPVAAPVARPAVPVPTVRPSAVPLARPVVAVAAPVRPPSAVPVAAPLARPAVPVPTVRPAAAVPATPPPSAPAKHPAGPPAPGAAAAGTDRLAASAVPAAPAKPDKPDKPDKPSLFKGPAPVSKKKRL